MRSFIIAIALCTLAVFAQQTSYQLVWSDEFNGNSLDLSKWQYEVNCDGGGNAELQCYTNSPKNVAVQNGTLVITAIPENINGKQYSSGRINTKASAAWKYGRIDFSAKLPNGIYLWPALWMMPRDETYGWWAASGEIDIMENRGTQNTQESTLHYGGSWPNNVYQGSGPQRMNFDMTADFHQYSAIWTPTSIQFLVDNNVYYTQTLQKNFWSGAGSNPYTANGQPFDQYFFIIINLAVGGYFFGGDANSLTNAQARAWATTTLQVDYVRVYQLQTTNVNNNPAPVASPNPATTASSTTSSSLCTSMWSTLSCRTGSDNPSQVDVNGVANSRAWLCSTYPQFCTEINGNGKYVSCNSVQQLSYAMSLYYNNFISQGPNACSFGGIAKPVSAAAATPSSQNSATPSSQNNTPASSTTNQGQTPASTKSSSSSNIAPCARASYCGANTCACNGACYDITQYCCKSNSLTQIQFC